MHTISIESKILKKLGETFAAGLYEERNAPIIRKMSRAIMRYLEGTIPDSALKMSESLFPTGEINLWKLTGDQSLSFHYLSSMEFQRTLFEEKITAQLDSRREQEIAGQIASDLQNYCFNPMSTKFSVGGRGYTHSILNYRKLLEIELPGYRAIRRMLLGEAGTKRINSRRSARVGRWLKKLQMHGLVAKVPRSRCWKVTQEGRKIMQTALEIYDVGWTQIIDRQAA